MTRLLVHLAFAGIRARLLGSVLTDRDRRRCRDDDRAGAGGALDGRRPVAAHVRRGARRPRPRRRCRPRRTPSAWPGCRASPRRAPPSPSALSTLGHGDRTEPGPQLVGSRRGADRERAGADGRERAARRRRGARAEPRARQRGSTSARRCAWAGPTLPVVGLAIVPSQPRYPRSNPGVAWVTQPDVRADRHRPRGVALAGGRAARQSRRRGRVRRAGERDIRARRARLRARRLPDLAAAAPRRPCATPSRCSWS